MSEMKCNYQRKVSIEELSTALAEMACHNCSVSTADLMLKGELLEVCGEEFSSDIVGGECVLSTIALCPTCHAESHLDAHHQHNPCLIKARLSREHLA